jgi:hypothetical protein
MARTKRSTSGNLGTQYENSTDTQKVAILNRLWKEHGSFKAMRLELGWPAGKVQRQFASLTGSVPEASRGRPRGSGNGAATTSRSTRKAASAKKAPAKKASGARTKKATKPRSSGKTAVQKNGGSAASKRGRATRATKEADPFA